MTYAWLSLAFLAASVLVAVVAVVAVLRVTAGEGRGILPIATGAVVLCTLVLFALTAAFDNVMIAVGLMRYSARQITGLHVGAAPLEDFAYPLAAAILLPSLWVLLTRPCRRRR